MRPPPGWLGTLQGMDAYRHSSARVTNEHFSLDEEAGFREDRGRQTLIFPVLTVEGSASQSGCFVSRLDSPGANHLRDVTFRPVMRGKSIQATLLPERAPSPYPRQVRSSPKPNGMPLEFGLNSVGRQVPN